MASRYAIHIDCFTSLDELKARERSDPMAVLAVLRETKRFSAFDMYDMRLVRSIEWLERRGHIRTDVKKFGFPWVAVEIIEPQSDLPRDDPRDDTKD